MEKSHANPNKPIHVNIYSENSQSAHRHDQSEGSEFLDDAIHMHDPDSQPDETISSSETPEDSPAPETEN
jgi:hypothetical protein